MVLFQHFGLEATPIFKHFELNDFNYPLHLHRAFEIIAVRRGQLHIQIEKKNYVVNPDQFVIIFPNQVHGFNMMPNSTATVIIFSPEIVGAFSEQYYQQVPENPVIFDNQPFNFEKTTNIFAIKGFLYTLSSKVVEQTEFITQKTSEKLNIVHQIIDYINNNYTHKCTLQDAANVIGYDYVYLSKLFQKIMDLSFTKYLNRIRISEARRLLKNTNESITQIAFNVGYANLRTFNRNFKALNHINPADYRKTKETTKYAKAIQVNYISG